MVTYGTAPTPFLALRVLQQLANDGDSQFLLEAKAIRDHSYVDYIFVIADDINQYLKVRDEVISIFNADQFPMEK